MFINQIHYGGVVEWAKKHHYQLKDIFFRQIVGFSVSLFIAFGHTSPFYDRTPMPRNGFEISMASTFIFFYYFNSASHRQYSFHPKARYRPKSLKQLHRILQLRREKKNKKKIRQTSRPNFMLEIKFEKRKTAVMKSCQIFNFYYLQILVIQVKHLHFSKLLSCFI